MKNSGFLVAVIAVLAACGGDAEPAGSQTSAANVPAPIAAAADPVVPTTVGEPTTTTTAEEPPTTTVAAAETLPPTSPQSMPTAMTEDLRYHPGGEPFVDRSGGMDVIAPVEGGPWPTVVAFHGDPRFASKGWHRPDAQLIAEQGRVVFLPAWGHFDSSAVSDLGGQAVWEMVNRELSCAVLFAHAHTEGYGGDPDNITLYGLSVGGNAVLTAGLADYNPLQTCSEAGGPVEVQALVPIDADWTLGGGWDTLLRQQPEIFYLQTPWRHLDGSQEISIRLMVPEHVGAYTRYVGPEPETSWLSYRHPDIDLVADLDARGYLADGQLSLKESNEYAFEILLEMGHDATLTVMPEATHENWGEEGTAVVVETVVAAGEM